MSVFSLATLKKNFGFNDDVAIKYEKRDEELIIHLPIVPEYRSNDEIINQAQELVKKRKAAGWSRQDFFNDFLKVRDEVLKKIRAHYERRQG
ncbi:hypothetical protein KJ693_09595 [bacterium]|nr:hypothetical protein [bacterium]MBU1615546.1 hypothetical protein [bacterium]